MTTSASPQGTVEPGRAIERARGTVPVSSNGRDVALRAVQQAMPVVARTVAAGMAVIAVEQAVRRVVAGASERVLPRRIEAVPRPYVATFSMTETVVIERMRRRR